MGNMSTKRPHECADVRAGHTWFLEDWLTVEQAARVAGVSVATIIMWIEQGKVPAFYVANETQTVH